MRWFLFFLFFTVSFGAGTSYGIEQTLLKPSTSFSVSNLLNLIGFSFSTETFEYCKQNNLDKCDILGYTEVSCPDNNALACPFDSNKLKCSSWTCADLNLFDFQPELTECQTVPEVEAMYGISCLKCQCDTTSVNIEFCDVDFVTMLNGSALCAQMGYVDSMRSCVDYVACPSNFNQVRCLDIQTCTDENCLARVDIPANALPTYTNVPECSCGRPVITDWSCKPGYIKQNGACVSTSCPAGEYEGPSLLSGVNPLSYHLDDCYNQNADEPGDTGLGWKKVATLNQTSNSRTCYRCVCEVSPAACPYVNGVSSNAGTYGKLEDACCDAEYDLNGKIKGGAHFRRCVRACPTNAFVPEHAVPNIAQCDACGETTEYIADWYCSAEEGYTLSESQTSCDILDCPLPINGEYYNIDYVSLSNCENIVTSKTRNAQGELVVVVSEGWEYVQGSPHLVGDTIQNYKSGGEICNTCKCNIENDSQTYKWTTADSDNQTDVQLEHLGCNGKYRSCTIKDPSRYLANEPVASSHVAEHNTRKLCGETLYQIEKCERGYLMSANGHECIIDPCVGYIFNSQAACPEHGECDSYCYHGPAQVFKLDRCLDDVQNEIHYRLVTNSQDIATGCCQETCETGYELNKTCKEGETAETILNGCGDPCTKCTRS